MVVFARETGSMQLAEVVETEAELATLRRLGVGRSQGYLLGRSWPPRPTLAVLWVEPFTGTVVSSGIA